MSKRVKKESKPLFSKTNNDQKFSTLRLIPAINQKNYFTHYLKKDSQFLCRKIRERPELDDSKTAVFHLGSQNLRVGFSDDDKPRVLPFNLAKPQKLYGNNEPEEVPNNTVFEEGLEECKSTFLARMKSYKIRVTQNSNDICTGFNSQQSGSPVNSENEFQLAEHKFSKLGDKIFCLKQSDVPEGYQLFWPFIRSGLNEDPQFYSSAEELNCDIQSILEYVCKSPDCLNITDFKNVSSYDAVVVIPDMFDRTTLTVVIDSIFKIGFSNVAIIEEAVAATYGSGISSACVVNIGAQTTSVTCVDEGMAIPDSRVKFDYGGDQITNAFGRLLNQIDFPGEPDFDTLDALKREFLTANENDISVQLFKYYKNGLKYDFKVYDQVFLPILGLFEPKLLVAATYVPWKNRLFPRTMDPYSGHVSEPISDADINVRLGSLAHRGLGYEKIKVETKPMNGNADQEALDRAAEDLEDNDNDTNANPESAAAASAKQNDEDAQIQAYESLDPKRTSVSTPLHLGIIESIFEAQKHSGTAKQYYTNLVLVGGGSKVPNLNTLLTDFLATEHHNNKSDIAEISVVPIPQEAESDTLCWRGGVLYSKLKVIDEMWTTRTDWDTLGSRSLHYKASLYIY